MVQRGVQITESFKSVGLRKKRPRVEVQHKLPACTSTPKKVRVNTIKSCPVSPCPGSQNDEPLISLI
jgi:hypothetical protein